MLAPLLQFCRTPVPIMLAAGSEGETLIARMRVIIIVLLLVTPTYKIIIHPDYPVYFWGFWVTVIGAVEAVTVLAILRWQGYHPWLGFTSSIFDVTFVTLALTMFMALDYPLIALNSKVTFEIYFLAITATSLRYDRRICIAAGFVAIAQYATLNVYGSLHFDLDQQSEIAATGRYNIVDQITRLIMMTAAVALAYALVVRGGKLLHMSMHDGLTGIYNRNCFDTFAGKLLDEARRSETTLAIVMFDVDHFKQINDRFGHQRGDKVLVHIATTLGSRTRPLDMLARFGGEEFVLAMPDIGADEAVNIVDRIRSSVTSENMLLPDMRVTLSAGVALFPLDAGDMESLIAVADKRLLRAKRSGRDRTQAT